MIISFAWTTPAVVIGEKTETRRDWSPKTIASARKQMEEGRLFDAWDKSARFGGKPFGKIRILEIIENEDSRSIPDEAWIAEGFHVLEPLGAMIGGSRPSDVWYFWRTQNAQPQTVIRFEVVELNDHGRELQAQAIEKTGFMMWERPHPIRPELLREERDG